MAKLILLADNDLDFLSKRGDLFEASGYTVIKASSPEQAKKLLKESYVHLALLDVRLKDDNDDKDVSGIQLARDAENKRIPKIMITSHPSYEYVLAALGPSIDGEPPSVDFVYKEDGFPAMLSAIERVLKTRLQINENLSIGWAAGQFLSFPGLVPAIEEGLPLSLLANRVQEMEDLFRQLFNFADRITILQQFGGGRGRCLIEVLVYSEGKVELMLVTLGKNDSVTQELERFELYIPHTFQVGSLALLGHRETLHYAAIAWSFITDGAPVDHLASFTTYYKSHSEKQIRATLEDFFQGPIKTWGEQGRRQDDQPLLKGYQAFQNAHPQLIEPDEIVRRIESLASEGLYGRVSEVVFQDKKLEFRLANGQSLITINPLPYLFEHQPNLATRNIIGLSMGGLDCNSLLIDKQNRTWLSNFSQLGMAPIWLDYASLENEVRFKLVEADNLQYLREFEECLLMATRLGEIVSIETLPSELHKPASSIQTIRYQTSLFTGDDLKPYLVSLLFTAAREFTLSSSYSGQQRSDIEALMYRLLFCGLICERLDELNTVESIDEAPSSPRTLLLDELNHEVRVGNHLIDLTMREYDLLLYLYKHPNKLCTRGEILKEVFGIQNPSHNDEESLLNTNISRVRKKIEPNPEKPIFLETIRGVGFKLTPQPQ